MNHELHKRLNYSKAYRANRLKAAQWVLGHPETVEELLAICFEPSQNELSHKANWVLEFVFLENNAILYPHLDFFFNHLSNVTKDQSLRPLSHLCELLAISYYKKKDSQLQKKLSSGHKKVMVDCCFDWLISDQKVACEVRAMTALYFLGTEYGWIHPELTAIIVRNIENKSAGYKARGKRILKSVTRYNHSNIV